MKTFHRTVQIIAMAATFSPINLHATDKLDTYLAVEGGMAFYQKFNQEVYQGLKPNSGDVFGIALGKYIHKNFAIEGGINRFGDIEPNWVNEGIVHSQKIKATNFNVNLKYVANNLHPHIKPYANIGVGVAIIDSGALNSTNGQDTYRVDGKLKYNASYNIGFGTMAPLSDDLSLRVGYQFFALGKNGSAKNYMKNIDNVGSVGSNSYGEASAQIKAHTVLVGLQYSF
ncbi:MAG: outer membrane protein [Rickettsiales bacterium]